MYIYIYINIYIYIYIYILIVDDNNNIVKVVKVVKAIKAVKVAKKEHSVEMPDTEISRWQAFDAGKHLTLASI